MKGRNHTSLNGRLPGFGAEGDLIGEGVEGFRDFGEVDFEFGQIFNILLQNLN